MARHYLLNRGVPEAVIFIDEQSTVTRENIHNAKIIMARQHMQTALLVSDPLHMLRMRLIAYDNDMVSWSSPTTTSRYRSWQTQLPFLLREAFYYTGYRILRYLPAIPPENNAP
nr:YdcF family protein [Kluyvera intermedia]